MSFLRNVYCEYPLPKTPDEISRNLCQLILAVAVFDWDNQAVYLAERVDCGTEPDAEAIPAGVDTVLSIEGNCS